MGARSTKQWRVFDSNQWAAQDGNYKATWRNLTFEILVTRTYVVSFESTSSAGSYQSTYTTFWHNYSISINHLYWIFTINSDPTYLMSPLYQSHPSLFHLLLHSLSLSFASFLRIHQYVLLYIYIIGLIIDSGTYSCFGWIRGKKWSMGRMQLFAVI